MLRGEEQLLQGSAERDAVGVHDNGGVVNTVVLLRNPVLNGTTMTYDVTVTQGSVPSNVDGASLFIDVVGMPRTPVSYAGAARRAVVY
ncbi:MAG: hypothetical protein ACJ796_02365 [Gemmatimonadaceae bacterium]